jgi:uncharacterized protein (TIGR02646 family)
MKSYNKQNAPAALNGWDGSRHPWSDFCQDRVSYNEVKQSLTGEQNHLCCYCESAIKDSDSHIEHYKPRSRKQMLMYDYSNLACSCNGGINDDRHCGHKKDNNYNDKLFIDPSKESSGNLFNYDTGGGVGPRQGISRGDADRVNYMIQILNLDKSPKLRGMRREQARSILNMIDGLINAGLEDQLEEMASYYLVPNNDGKLYQFYSLSLQLFGEVGNRVIDER